MRAVLNVLAVAALVASLVFAWWSSRHRDNTPPPASPSSASVRDLPAAVPGAHPAPFEAFAAPQVGDWYAYTTQNDTPYGKIPTHAVGTVSVATDELVTVAFTGSIDQTGERRDSPGEKFPRHGLTLERLFGHDIGNWTISNVTITDEPHGVGGRSFPCKRVSYDAADPMFPRKQTHVDHWISTEVPVGGLVETHEVQHLDSLTFDTDLVLVGFGTATATTWGTRPTGL